MIDQLKLTLKKLYHFFKDPRYRQIKLSGLFHENYYLKAYPEIAESSVDPLFHYLQMGVSEDRKPNFFFTPSFYRLRYLKVSEIETEPIVHYLETEPDKNIFPSPLFWTDFYLNQFADSSRPSTNPLQHYFKIGWKQGKRPSRYIDLGYYKKKYPDVAGSSLSPLDHFLTKGLFERRQPSPYFDVDWYIDKNPHLDGYQGDIIQHYFQYGVQEEKSPLPLFDPVYYKNNNPEIDFSEIDPLTSYLKDGITQDSRPCEWFDPKFYRTIYPEIKKAGLSPLRHYLERGVYQGYYTNDEVYCLKDKPTISIIVPVYDADKHFLNNCIRSVLYQSYPHWELCLADDCSTRSHVAQVLKKWDALDKRIKITFLDENRGIAGATIAAASMATGDYISFLDNDDELSNDCLYETVKKIIENDADFVYTDEKLIGEDQRVFSHFYKPDFNKELLLCHNYITHFIAVKRELYNLTGGISEDYSGAQDYDLFLKLAQTAKKIEHIPKQLYLWRASETSTSINHEKKEYANEAGRKALAAAMNREKIAGKAEFTDWKFFYRSKRTLISNPSISVIIHIEQAKEEEKWQSIERMIEESTYPKAEYVIISRLSNPPQFVNFDSRKVLFLQVKKDENKAQQFNRAVALCKGQYLVFIDDSSLPVNKDWIEVMLEYAQRDDVGVVGGRVLPAPNDKTINLTVPDITDNSPIYYAQFFQGCSAHMNGLECSQEVQVAPFPFCMMKKALFDTCNGFDQESMPNLFFPHNLNLQLLQKGCRNIYTPYAIAQSCESRLKSDAKQDYQEMMDEKSRFQRRWKDIIERGDLYWNNEILYEKGIDHERFRRWYRGVKE